MKTTSLSLLSLFLLLTLQLSAQKKVIIGYVMGDRMDTLHLDIQADRLTHINYAFANIEDGRIVDGHSYDKARLKQLQKLKILNPELKLLVSVGGWAWSDHFSDAALTPQSRNTFANSAVEMIKKHRLDGIDLDWEYPGQPGEGNTYRPEDKKNFTLTLKLIREKLDSLSSKTREKYLLTIAAAANQKYIDNVELTEIQKYLDYINIMNYDYTGGWDTVTSHHTNLYPSAANGTHEMSTSLSVDLFLKAGALPSKLVMGVAFYGRGWNGVNPENNGLFQKAEKNAFSTPYKVIRDSLKTGNYIRKVDSKAKTPYLWNPITHTFVSYEDPFSLQQKMTFLKEKKLAGVMFWEYHGDNGDLLKTLAKELLD